ncbi:hypothetical protein [Streptomyces europaeiscabiei]|uniref:hypothetical protein n=1 Tax=Streptomyces europaeiscabiei TaxID=146819 RepID=UPI002E1052AB|nr:hypothetical protein OHB30_00195 [Streptomyces europaeiscabiei]WSG28396.1 hypothetical protein OHB30_50135 [Streptomyces europaeiscabiei]
MARVGDGGQAAQQPLDPVFLLLLVPFGVCRAAFEQLGERAAEDGDVAAAGPEQLQVLLHRPAGERAGTREVQADGVDPVLVGGVEQQVADQLPRFGLAERAGVPGALEVEKQSVDEHCHVD